MGAFLDKIKRSNDLGLYSCAGLDPTQLPPHLCELFPSHSLEACRQFLYKLVVAAVPHAAAFKPNWAFFIKQGSRGLALLEDLCAVIRAAAPHALLILDMKCGDIGDTNEGYRHFAWQCQADAITVHPYMGYEAMRGLLEDPNKGAFVLCRTSNKGSDEFQNLEVGCLPLFRFVAERVQKQWNQNGNCGLVMGATYPEDIPLVRQAAPDLPLLIPGIGKQGGDLERTVGNVGKGTPFLVNQSSSFMRASTGEDFAGAGAEVLKRTNAKIAALLSSMR